MAEDPVSSGVIYGGGGTGGGNFCSDVADDLSTYSSHDEHDDIVCHHVRSGSPEAAARQQHEQQLQKEQEFVKKETFRVNVSKFIVVLAIVIAGVVCGVMTHDLVQQSDVDEFYDAVKTYQTEIEGVSQDTAVRAFTAIGSLSKSITASAVIANQGSNNDNNNMNNGNDSNNSSLFPFYSMPFFHIQAGETQQQSGAEAIIYAPLVHKSQQGAWEEYSTNHQEWIHQGLTYRGVNVKENDPGLIPNRVSSYRKGDQMDYDYDERIPGTVHMHDYILPIWQMAGAPINASIVNMDLLTSSSFEHTMVDVLIERHGILSEIDDFSYLTVYSTAMTSKEELDKNHNSMDYTIKDAKPTDTVSSSTHPQSYMLEPVFESFEDNAPIVGFVIAIFPWNTYFLNVLPKGVDMLLVIKDRCGHTKTWEINGPTVSYKGEGNFSRAKHEHVTSTFEFAPNARYNNRTGGDHPVEYIYGLQDEKDGTSTTTATSPPTTTSPSSFGGRKTRTMRHMQEMGTEDTNSSAYVEAFGVTYDERFQDMDHLSHCAYVLELQPSVSFEVAYDSGRPKTYAFGVGVIFGIILLFLFAFDIMVVRRQRKLMEKARKTHAVVASLFPENVQERILEDAHTHTINRHNKKSKPGLSSLNTSNSFSANDHSSSNQGTGGSSGVIGGALVYGSKPIADFFRSTTILFADLAGFTAWSSKREPTHVFQLLEKIYFTFDALARARGVFKVETIGDCYMAACGLPETRDDHAVVMARFARDCLHRYPTILREMVDHLGPGVKELGLRTGLHSGPVTAGVLRGEKSRFQLFGDTVNTASRMESTGVTNRIQISHETMKLLVASGKKEWVQPRETTVTAKGKGELQTYWLLSRYEQASLSVEEISMGEDDDEQLAVSIASA